MQNRCRGGRAEGVRQVRSASRRQGLDGSVVARSAPAPRMLLPYTRTPPPPPPPPILARLPF
ncbi:hypothetical protein E2C01_062908 [Portunus trituberculatus]|uniref:Uncharacterized protein n=1 Tax=Portunus trituberculatus TaxID=210409 RepID=A0A5B7HF07_PORTR|nr:hypothetical protein [Portunus trituberculatus]